MAYTLDFTAVQQSDLSKILLTDTSSGGAEPSLTSRRIYLYKLDGTTLVPDGTTTEYIDWPIVNPSGIGDTIELNVLSRDYSLRIFVVTTSSSPVVGATYTKSEVFTTVGFSNLGAYEILETISADPSNLNDPDFRLNFYILGGEIENAELAQDYENQFSAQAALDRAFQMLSNRSYYF